MNRQDETLNPVPSNPLETYNYDPVGNRTNSNQNGASVFNQANQLLEDASFTYQYDNNGNLTRKTSKTPGPFTNYEYDAENKLVRVVSNGTVVNYKYDGLGRRVEKEVNDGVTTKVTRFIYDNEDILLELDTQNSILARYTHGPGIDEPLIMEKAGASFFYHADGLGSITEITDSLGVVRQRYTYSSFGKIESQLDPNFVQPYTYTSREFDPETDLYHYRTRQYDWRSGRFTGQDDLRFASLRLPASLNLYSYVLNNPVRYIDPNGHKPSDVCPLPLPAGFDRFSDCFGSCAADALRENLETLGRNLQRSVLTGTALGVGVCAAITISEPYLLPVFPVCAGVAAASTTGVLAIASVANFNVGTAASLAGCGVGCMGF